MTTKIENIPLKTNKTSDINDDTNDPMVQDILNEFQHEIELNEEESSKQKNYNINYVEPQPAAIVNQEPQQYTKKTKKCLNNSNSFSYYYNDDYIRKSAIIIIIIAFVFSPIIYNSIFSKNRFADFFEENNLYVKLGLSFIVIYIMMFNNLI